MAYFLLNGQTRYVCLFVTALLADGEFHHRVIGGRGREELAGITERRP